MTSLSANREAAAFLGNHPCSSYFRHMDLMKMADEEEELAQREWIKVYGALFGCEEKAAELFDAACKDAE